MKLRAGYVVASVLVAGWMLGAYVLFAIETSQQSHSYRELERAQVLADVILNSFISHSHSGNNSDIERFMNYLSDSRAGGVKSIHLISAGDVDEPYTKILLQKATESADILESSEERQVVHVTRAIVNQDSCRKCHNTKGDVLAFLRLEMEADEAAYRSYDLKGKLLQRGFIIGFVLLGFMGLTAILFKATDNESDISWKPDTSDKPTKDFDRGGFGALFASLNALGKTPNAKNIQSMEKVEKMATIGELSSAIAHEIKNPLAGISGAIQVLIESLDADDQRREVMDEILAEIQRLDKTIRNLMAFARPPEPSLIRTPVSAIIERTATLIAGQAKKQFVDVNIVPVDGMAIVLADPDQIQQVLLNIMMNALHVMHEGGTLGVTTRILTDDKIVEVAISNTGEGIPEKNMAYIFEPFFTTKTSGTGLGLAICRNIIERHEGSIHAHSSKGTGSTFIIRLPLRETLND